MHIWRPTSGQPCAVFKDFECFCTHTHTFSWKCVCWPFTVSLLVRVVTRVSWSTHVQCRVDQLTKEVWDYIFLGASCPQTEIGKEKLEWVIIFKDASCTTTISYHGNSVQWTCMFGGFCFTSVCVCHAGDVPNCPQDWGVIYLSLQTHCLLKGGTLTHLQQHTP